MNKLFLPFLALLSLALCSVSCAANRDGSSAIPGGQSHDEHNAVYFWRTVFDIDSAEMAFLKSHDVGRIYLRMFDVAIDPDGFNFDTKVVPNATVRFPDNTYKMMQDSLADIQFVPTVYITLEALKAAAGKEGRLARNIVARVKNMASYNGIPGVAELQLDCDWTSSTEESFFRLCDSVRAQIDSLDTPWALSSTIRLHQLARPIPPVDRGILMVYNTGSFNDPDASNSIISVADVEPYLKHLPAYPLHLDIAYPSYSWQLLFHNRSFAGLLNGLDLTDSSRFSHRSDNIFVALSDFPYNNHIIRAGDIIRHETSSPSEILKVKALIESRLKGRPHSNILYHLDSDNLTKYSSDDINKIFDNGND